MSSDMISTTITNILDRQLEKMDKGEISVLQNNLLISDNIKTYVQFHDMYKKYLDEVYFKNYLNNFFIYNKTYDKLSLYDVSPINKNLANNTIMNISDDKDFYLSNLFIYNNDQYFYLATKNREIKAGLFTEKHIGYILYEINLKNLKTSLNIVNKSNFLNTQHLPSNTNNINSFYQKSTLNKIYFSSPIDFIEPKFYIYKDYSMVFFNYIYMILLLSYLVGIFVIHNMKIDFRESFIKNITSLNFNYNDKFEKNPEEILNQLIAKKDFEIEFLKTSNNKNKLEVFKNIYLKYYSSLQLPNYVVFYSLKNMIFVFNDKIDLENNHIEILEKLQLNSDCIKDIRANYFDNSFDSLINYANNISNELINSLKDFYIYLFSIKEEPYIILIKKSSKEKIKNLKSIIKNL